jgi:hypothetical protein
MHWEITIVADTNDADYVTSINEISDEDLALIKPLIEAIRMFTPYSTNKDGMKWQHSHNYPNGEYAPRTDLGEMTTRELYCDFDEEVFQIFEYLCPTGEYGIHSIKSIHIAPTGQKIRLL